MTVPLPCHLFQKVSLHVPHFLESFLVSSLLNVTGQGDGKRRKRPGPQAQTFLLPPFTAFRPGLRHEDSVGGGGRLKSLCLIKCLLDHSWVAVLTVQVLGQEQGPLFIHSSFY